MIKDEPGKQELHGIHRQGSQCFLSPTRRSKNNHFIAQILVRQTSGEYKDKKSSCIKEYGQLGMNANADVKKEE